MGCLGSKDKNNIRLTDDGREAKRNQTIITVKSLYGIYAFYEVATNEMKSYESQSKILVNSPEVFDDKGFPQDIKSLSKSNPKNFGDLLKVDAKKIKWKRAKDIFKNFTIIP